MSQISKAQMGRNVVTLTADLLERVNEGALARVKRYFTDKKVRVKLAERAADRAGKDFK